MVWRKIDTVDESSISFVSQDHIFESITARDTYFTDNLDELVANTPIIVNDGTNVIFQVWRGTTNPDTYDSSLWTTTTFPDQFTDLVDTPNSYIADRSSRLLTNERKPPDSDRSTISPSATVPDSVLSVPGMNRSPSMNRASV